MDLEGMGDWEAPSTQPLLWPLLICMHVAQGLEEDVEQAVGPSQPPGGSWLPQLMSPPRISHSRCCGRAVWPRTSSPPLWDTSSVTSWLLQLLFQDCMAPARPPFPTRGPQEPYMLLRVGACSPRACRPQCSLPCHERPPPLPCTHADIFSTCALQWERLGPTTSWLPGAPLPGFSYPDSAPSSSPKSTCLSLLSATGTSAASEGLLLVPVACQSECMCVCGHEYKCMSVPVCV